MNIDVIFEENNQQMDATFGEFMHTPASDSLPFVTEADNGKVLQVTDGRWAAAEAPQGGADGESISVVSITESTEDGGENVVTFSDGSTLTVKNGSKGNTGANGKDGADGKDGVDGKDGIDGIDGTSVSIVSITQSEEDGGSNVVTFSDGSTLTVKNGKAGAGASITVDTELSEESENPVQNKVITTQFNAALDGIGQGMTDLEQAIMTLYTAMASALAVPASVDMSGFDSGTIVETFADGSTKTTTIEFDADGNPIKIRDGDGRVTTYTW